MKRKSDAAKKKEKRCLGEGNGYTPWIRAREAGSIGTAVSIWDPVAKRKVETLSQGEAELFWILRFQDGIKEIKEQIMLAPDIVSEICIEYGFRKPIHILSTDLLAEYEDGRIAAYSVKSDRTEFMKEANDPEKQRKLLERVKIEQEYWQRHGAAFCLVFRNELNRVYAKNVETVMAFYDPGFVSDEEDMLKFLIAHKMIRVDMEAEPIAFAKMKRMFPEAKELYYKELSVPRYSETA